MSSNKKNNYARRFKAKAENLSEQFRKELGLNFYDPLDARLLAKHLNVTILPFSQIKKLPPDQLQHLFGNGLPKKEVHGITIKVDSLSVVLHNDSNSTVRQQSDIFHELSHILCDHKHEHEFVNTPFDFLRSYKPTEEREAEYLGAALQIPRGGLIALLKKEKSIEYIADLYTSSTELVTFRIYQTGANIIAKRARKQPIN